MQRIELRLSYFPDTNNWRLYNGETYREIPRDLVALAQAVAASIEDTETEMRNLSNQIRMANMPPFGSMKNKETK